MSYRPGDPTLSNDWRDDEDNENPTIERVTRDDFQDETRSPDSVFVLDRIIGISSDEFDRSKPNPVIGSDGNKPKVYSAAILNEADSTETDLKYDYKHPYYTTDGIPASSRIATEEKDGVSRLIVKDNDAKFQGDSYTRTYNTYSSNSYFTQVDVAGKNGGESVRYNICASKVYAQHLFLGATVKSFNASLAWGSEASRLTVELVVDTCKYPELKDMNGDDVQQPTTDNHYIDTLTSNDFAKDELGNSIIPGKVYYVPQNGTIVSRYWYAADPGFYADIGSNSMEIVGMAAYFKYDNFEYSGIVASWEKKSGSAGINEYTVILETPTSLLSGTSVILDDYAGSIHQNVNSNSVYAGDSDNPGFPALEGGSDNNYGGLIREQSMPNVVNAFGFLEDAGFGSNSGFGGSMKNSRGIPAYKVMSALTYLLDSPQTWAAAGDGQWRQNSSAWKMLRYSPYGRMVGPHPRYKDTPHNVVNVATTDNYRMGICHFVPNNLAFTNGATTTLTPYSLDLNDFFFNNFSILNPEYRLSDKTSTVMDIVNNIADAHGYEVFVSMYMVPDGNFFYPRLKINLATKRITPAENTVQNFINIMTANDINITNSSLGEEYNTQNPTRTMILGGKQKRIYQTKFTKYAVNQNTIRWNPYTNTMLNTTAATHNVRSLRLANETSTRNSNLGYGLPGLGNNNIIDVLGRVNRENPAYLYSTVNWGGLAFRLNYSDPINLAMPTVPTDFDADSFGQICPYLGKDPFSQMARGVTYDDAYGQFFFYIAPYEFAKLTGSVPTQYIGISENELRAAMKGFDEFAAYVLGLAFQLGGSISTHKFDLMNHVLMPMGIFPKAFATGAANFNKYTNTTSGSDYTPVSPTSSLLSSPFVAQALSSIQTFLKNLGDEYYGKQFMISVPRPQYTIDYNNHFYSVGNLPTTGSRPTEYYSLNGTKEVRAAFKPTDSGWEEAGSTIDDSLMAGTAIMHVFTNDDGTIAPIVGYNASNRFNYVRQFEQGAKKSFFNPVTTAQNRNYYHFSKWDIWNKSGFGGAASPTDYSKFFDTSLVTMDSDGVDISYPTNYIRDPFDADIVPNAFKRYIKSSVEPDFVWASAPGTSTGQVLKFIVKNQGTFLNPSHINELNVSTAIADYHRAFWDNTNINALRLNKILSSSALYVSIGNNPGLGNDGNNTLASNYVAQNEQNKPNKNYSLAPKAAIPAFAAVPFESDIAIYGPWVSAPDKFVDSIFPYSDDIIGKANRLENMIGGTKVLNEPDLVPWNFGGMINLDMYAILRATDDNNYQQKFQTGQLSYYGTPFFNLANELKSSAWLFGGPLINNIQTQVTAQGPLTTYSFRTYTKKFTLFNKENADRLKQQAAESIAIRKQLLNRFENLKTDLKALSKANNPANMFNFTSSKLRSASPSTILVGMSKPYQSPADQLNSTPKAYPPLNADNPESDGISYLYNIVNSVQRTNIGLYNVGEVAQELEDDYANKAFMSLDGLFSPVSFYPTLGGGTAPYKSFYQTGCPLCNGTFIVNGQPCQLCSDQIAGTEKARKYTVLPPFITSDQSDSDLFEGSNPTSIQQRISALLDTASSRKRINYVNLNPIIMPVGEMRNSYAKYYDRTSHHIEYIGRNQVPPQGDLSIYNNKTTLGFDEDQSTLADSDNSGKLFDDNLLGRGISNWTQKNYRFMALRGPLVLSGWGFDTAGYPVPNASGEPQGFTNGFPLRIENKYDQNPTIFKRGPILGKNQYWDPATESWSDPIPENTFAEGWGTRPDKFMTGPVDLRWDEDRKVWTTPKPYPMVYVQLEMDLKPPYPARGFLDAIDKDTPLSNGLRRAVFVRDSSESYGAPRGAKILCFYDEASGFYEPVSKNPISALGTINGAVATIVPLYAAGFNAFTGAQNGVSPLDVTFQNPMGFTLSQGQVGFFTFLTNQWTLVSTNSCGL